jgi:hypothetical protein
MLGGTRPKPKGNNSGNQISWSTASLKTLASKTQWDKTLTKGKRVQFEYKNKGLFTSKFIKNKPILMINFRDIRKNMIQPREIRTMKSK